MAARITWTLSDFNMKFSIRTLLVFTAICGIVAVPLYQRMFPPSPQENAIELLGALNETERMKRRLPSLCITKEKSATVSARYERIKQFAIDRLAEIKHPAVWSKNEQCYKFENHKNL